VLPHLLNIRDSKEERRHEGRIVVDRYGVLEILNAGEPRVHNVRVVDFTQSGMTLHCPDAMKPGTSVRVKIGDSNYLGCIRHCTQLAEEQFRLGMRVEHLYRD
jgi:hypothetical protein